MPMKNLRKKANFNRRAMAFVNRQSPSPPAQGSLNTSVIRRANKQISPTHSQTLTTQSFRQSPEH